MFRSEPKDIKICYVYSHTRLDKNEIFYIGIGACRSKRNKYSRSVEFRRRNKLWDKVYAKTAIRVDIIEDGLSWDQACKKEIELIFKYGRKDLKTGTLTNLTAGGDGRFQSPNSIEVIEKIRKNKIGKKASEETKAKMRAGHVGRIHKKGFNLSTEHKKKISIGHKGKIFSEKTKLKMSQAQKGKYISPENRIRQSIYMKNKIVSKETRDKQAISLSKGEISAFKAGVLIGTYRSAPEAAKELNCCCSHIYSVINLKLKYHKGFTFLRTNKNCQLSTAA